MKKNVTVKLDESLLKQSKHLAVEEDKSLSEWVACLIAQAVKKSHWRDSIRRNALKVLDSPLKLGGKVFSRDELS